MKRILFGTREAQVASVDGINMFFGALLGANLGTLDGLAIADYAKVIAVLALTVAAIRMAVGSPQKVKAFATLLLYAALIPMVVLNPVLQPKGMSQADLHRLAATLLVWIGATILLEAYPTLDRFERRDAD